MARGKQTCKILKEIRKQIAEENDIQLVVEECTYQGDCLGTCPKCEAEVRYLERELEKRQRMGKAAVFAGMSLGTLFAATSCNNGVPNPEPLAKEPYVPDTTEMTADNIPSDTIPNEPFMLEGDVLAPVPDTMKAEEKKTACKIDVELTIPGDVVEVIEDKGADSYFLTSDTMDVTPEVGYVEPFGQESDPEDDVYMFVEQMPEFPGGPEAMMQYVAKHVNYPKEAQKAGVQGRVFVGFIVEADGSLTDFKVLRGIGYGCDEEAMRVAQSMPKWNPGMQRGKAVRVHYQFPVIFKLD